METINVIPVGTPVLIGYPKQEIPATIRQVCISADEVTYQAVYYDGRTRKSEWVTEAEIKLAPNLAPQPVGFT